VAELDQRDVFHTGKPGPVSIPDHELLRPIGEGSYGEIWLARTATGSLRAVKIVRRDTFEDERPYQREFTGLKHFEPVSREHEGLVDILQVGSNDTAGFFYYVMELADNVLLTSSDPAALASDPPRAARQDRPDPGNYEPLTLQWRIKTEGRLPAAECVRLAAALAEAVDFLHRSNLVHRDIKPSNILFVGGVPKLADVGLVARVQDARSFVGTEGFFPPEGPGKPSADIYSLGKVIYEMAMGKDRQAFPSPPTLLHELPDRDELYELNEIITKACAPVPAQRYRTAGEMVEELHELQAGRSVRRRRQRRFRQRLAAWGATAALAISGLVGLGWWWHQKTQPGLAVLREFQLPGGWPAHRALVGDFEGDGLEELLSAANGRVTAADLHGNLLREGVLPGFRGDTFGAGLLADTDQDGKKELFATGRDGTNLFVSVFNQGLNEVKRFTAAGSMERRSSGEYPSSGMSVADFVPATSNAPARLAVIVTSGYSIWPRYLRCYDYSTQATEWEFPFAATPISFRTCQATETGNAQILLGCYASDNGARLPDGTSDSRCYLRSLDSEGQLIWSHEVGDEFTRCLPQVGQVGGTNYIYALVYRTTDAWLLSQKQKPPFGHILKFDSAGRELARYEVAHELSSMLIADLPGARMPTVFATDGRGNLHVLDQALQLQQLLSITPVRHDWVVLRAEAAEDLNGDGRKELVLQSTEVEFVSGTNQGRPEGEANLRWYHNHQLLVYTSDLRRLAGYEINRRTQDGVGLAKIAVLSDHGTKRRDLMVLSQKAAILRLNR
jgi:hypothetical protein